MPKTTEELIKRMHEFNQAGFPGVLVHLMQRMTFMKSVTYG
jgi:hypothetical protein